MMSEVAKADVVITNPTHLAIALRYRADEMGAPRVLGKGAGFIAEKIREVARQRGFPSSRTNRWRACSTTRWKSAEKFLKRFIAPWRGFWLMCTACAVAIATRRGEG